MGTLLSALLKNLTLMTWPGNWWQQILEREHFGLVLQNCQETLYAPSEMPGFYQLYDIHPNLALSGWCTIYTVIAVPRSLIVTVKIGYQYLLLCFSANKVLAYDKTDNVKDIILNIPKKKKHKGSRKWTSVCAEFRRHCNIAKLHCMKYHWHKNVFF